MLQDLYISVEDEFGIPTDIWRYKETSEQVQIISNQNLEILTTFFFQEWKLGQVKLDMSVKFKVILL